MNFFPFHPGDYMLRTAHLEPLEDLAYRRLLDLYYVNELPVQGTPEEIARVIRLRSQADAVDSVLREFFEDTPEGWRHAHCDEVIAQYQAKAKTAAENGKKGGRPKKPEANPAEAEAAGQTSESNPAETQSVISANPAETGSKTNQEPLTINQEPEELPPLPPEGEEPAAPSRKFDPLTACPGNVSPVVWAEWVKCRSEMRKPLKETSCKAQAKQLANHPNPDAVIQASISAGWQGLFPDRIASNVHPIRPAAPASLDDIDYTAGMERRSDGSYRI